jgi:hypothetical protein
MACGCKKRNQTTQVKSSSTNVKINETKTQEEQSKRIVDAIITKLSN